MSPCSPPPVPPSSRAGPDPIDTGPIDTDRAAHDHWQRLVDARLIGTVTELPAETIAGIQAWERTLGIGRTRGGVW